MRNQRLAQQVVEEAIWALRKLSESAHSDEQKHLDRAILGLQQQVLVLAGNDSAKTTLKRGGGADRSSASALNDTVDLVRSPVRAAYPKFSRRHQELIKTAWSKSTNAEYEHRAPESLILEAARELSDQFAGEGRFTIDEVIRHLKGHGRSYPDYQVYLTFAWLRKCNLIRKHGRAEYELVPDAAQLEQAVTREWESLAESA